MGRQLYVSLADLRDLCDCHLDVESLPPQGEEGGQWTRHFSVIATPKDSPESVVFSLGGDEAVLRKLALGDKLGGAHVYTDCNAWSTGVDKVAWAVKLGIAFQVY